MRRFSLFICLVLIGFQFTYAQNYDWSQTIPNDSSIRKGVLSNGLTYYIKHNEQPKERASFYIYQNVGAILETEAQNGLAHFLEHMAFNGTKHFPGKLMLNTLANNGVAFGKDVNAYTGINETVYNMSRVPVQNEGLVDTCLLVLRDWCDDLLLTSEEIDAERGVITEEWRTKQSNKKELGDRIRKQTYEGSPYAHRDVIGTLDVIQNFDYDTLRQFYHDWYRTDLQGIAIVGDVDVDEIESKIQALFSDIKAVENPKPRVYPDLPDNEEPRFIVETSATTTSSTLSISYRKKVETENNLQSIRDSYVQSFFNTMMKERIKETMQTEQVFKGVQVRLTTMIKNYDQLKFSVSVREGKEIEGLAAAYTMLEQVCRYGFTAEELQRTQAKFLASIENSYSRREQKDNESYCKSIKNAFLNNRSLPSTEYMYQFTKEVIPSIQLEEVSALAQEWITENNQIWTVVGPTENETLLSKAQIQNVLDSLSQSDIAAYVPTKVENNELLTSMPEGGAVVSEKELTEFDAKEWMLSNGAKVVYRHADYEKESVVIKATSNGGLSLYESKDIPNVANLSVLMSSYGLGNLNSLEYSRVMTGNTASSSFSVSQNTETVTASSAPKDFETAMQLLYMRFEQPRFDREKFDLFMKRNQEMLDNKKETPESFMTDTLRIIYTQNSDRNRNIDQQYLDDISFERMNEIYHERFSDASDFTFYIVGNIDEEVAKEYAELYIGSIASKNSNESWGNHKTEFPKGKQQHTIMVPNTPSRGRVIIKMEKDKEISQEDMVYQTMMSSVLSLRFTENIREKEGGTYGVSVKPKMSKMPEGKLGLQIQFDCDKNRSFELKELVYNELKNVTKEVSNDDLQKIIQNMNKNYESQINHNSYWLGALQTYIETGDIAMESSYYYDIVNNATPEAIQNHAKKFFKKLNIVDVVFLSEI